MNLSSLDDFRTLNQIDCIEPFQGTVPSDAQGWLTRRTSLQSAVSVDPQKAICSQYDELAIASEEDLRAYLEKVSAFNDAQE